eukprot:60135-Rhodomonas_salina.2
MKRQPSAHKHEQGKAAGDDGDEAAPDLPVVTPRPDGSPRALSGSNRQEQAGRHLPVRKVQVASSPGLAEPAEAHNLDDLEHDRAENEQAHQDNDEQEEGAQRALHHQDVARPRKRISIAEHVCDVGPKVHPVELLGQKPHRIWEHAFVGPVVPRLVELRNPVTLSPSPSD